MPTEDLGVNTNLQGRGFKEVRISTPKKEVKPGMCGPPIPIKELKHAYGDDLGAEWYLSKRLEPGLMELRRDGAGDPLRAQKVLEYMARADPSFHAYTPEERSRLVN